MSRTKQFKKRFKDRIELRFTKGEARPSEQEYQNRRIRTAIVEIFKGLLGHEPTEAEILGMVDISGISTKKGIKKTLR